MTSFAKDFDKSTPASGDSPTLGDDQFRSDKQAIQERENVDHFWPFTGNKVDNTSSGEHRKITFHEQITAPEGAANKGFLYMKDVSDKPELHWLDEAGLPKQVTSSVSVGAVLNLELKDFRAAGSVITDEDTIEVHDTDGLQLKLGEETTGIKKTHLVTDAGEFVDEVTIENDDTNGLQVKAPTKGADADLLFAGLMAYGSYVGNDVDGREIDVGFPIHHLTIKTTDASIGNSSHVQVIETGSGTLAWRGALSSEGEVESTSAVTFVGNKFKLVPSESGFENAINKSSKTYYWFAMGKRPS